MKKTVNYKLNIFEENDVVDYEEINENTQNIEYEMNKLNNDKLSINGKAADSDKLDGLHSSDFSRSSHYHDDRYYTENEINNKLGSFSSLVTNQKDNLVGAINEVFTNASNGKTKIANAITGKGIQANMNDTFPTLANKISQISTGTNTTDANANANQILNGATAYVKNNKITGNIPILTGVRNTTDVNKWEDNGLAVYPERGYQKGGSGDGEIKVPAQSIINLYGITPDKIVAGNTICGINGTATILKSWSENETTVIKANESLSIDLHRYLKRTSVILARAKYRGYTVYAIYDIKLANIDEKFNGYFYNGTTKYDIFMKGGTNSSIDIYNNTSSSLELNLIHVTDCLID